MENFVKLSPELHPFVVPVVLVTCRDGDFDNVLAIAWFGVACSEPPHVTVAIRPGRTSNPIIRKTGTFGVCVPEPDMVDEVDFAGTHPGSKVRKFDALNLEVFYGEKTGVPLIKKCPVNAECKVKHVISLGTHDLFIGEVVSLYLRDELVRDGKLTSDDLNFLLYCHPQLRYYETGREAGKRGQGKDMRKEGV